MRQYRISRARIQPQTSPLRFFTDAIAPVQPLASSASLPTFVFDFRGFVEPARPLPGSHNQLLGILRTHVHTFENTVLVDAFAVVVFLPTDQVISSTAGEIIQGGDTAPAQGRQH